MNISRKPAAVAAFFVIAAVIAGCGSSSNNSIPKGAVASMAGNPVSLQAVDHWMYIAAKDESAQMAEEGESGQPVITAPDPPNFADCIKQVRASIPSLAKDPTKTLRSDCKEVFDEYMPEVLDYLIEGYWYQADAHKLGVTYSTKAENKEIQTVEKEFKTKTAFDAYLKNSGETMQDIHFQVLVSGLYDNLLTHYEKPVTNAEIASYYKSHKTEFATQATRSGHLIRVKTQSGAAAAVAALKSGGSWTVVAKKYAEDAASKADGGLVQSVAPNTYEAAANKVLFNSPVNTVEGPVKGVFGYYVIEVTTETPAVQKTLAEESSTIKSTLTATAKTAAEAKVTKYSKATWGKETVCTATYSVSDCVNYKPPVTTTTATATPTTSSSSTATGTTTGSSSTATGTTTGSSSTAATATASATATTSAAATTGATSTAGGSSTTPTATTG